MAKLPYTITICPDEPNPKQFTAMTPQLVNALRFGYDMTINQNQYDLGTEAMVMLHELIKGGKVKKKKIIPSELVLRDSTTKI